MSKLRDYLLGHFPIEESNRKWLVADARDDLLIEFVKAVAPEVLRFHDALALKLERDAVDTGSAAKDIWAFAGELVMEYERRLIEEAKK